MANLTRGSRRQSGWLASITTIAVVIALAGCSGNSDGSVQNTTGDAGHAVAATAPPEPLVGARGGSATAAQQQWFAQAQAFMARPAQRRDVLTALRARAMTHPGFCPDATFSPKRIDIMFDPAPRFTPDGTMVEGSILQRFTMEGCSTSVLLSVATVAAPGRPLRFIAGLPGTTFADMDLQEQAVPFAVGAARPLLPGCAQIGPIDTRLIGTKPDGGGTLVPWTEYWMVAGCGRLVNVKLHFTPDAAANRVNILADPREASVVRPASGGGAGAGIATQASASAGGRAVASATGTSAVPLGGAPVPAAKVAGTCLFKLREAGGAPPENVECTSPLPARVGATTQCTATRGEVKAPMAVTVTSVDPAAATLAFRCVIAVP